MTLKAISEQLNKPTLNAISNDVIKIHYVDGLCGSGKTFGLGKYMQKSPNEHKFIITTPSRSLATQIFDQFIELGIEHVYKIHSPDKSTSASASNVISEIMLKIDLINTLGHGVIICTQQAFSRIEFFENDHSWTLVIDEIPSIDKFDAPTLPYNHNLLSKYITLGEETGKTNGLYEMHSKDMEIHSNHDDVNKVFKHIVDDINDPNYRCYTDKAIWDKLVKHHQVTADTLKDAEYGNKLNKLYFLRLLQPTIYQGFKQVIMMGANFTQSLLHEYWSVFCNVQFIPFHEITENLRYTKYANGDRLTIHYLQEGNWSKTSANKMVNNKSKLDHFAKLVEEFMDNREFIYMTNNDDSREFTHGKKAPVISHGINHFSDIDNIYFSPALNNQPKHNTMLGQLGFDNAFIKRAMFHEIAHQAIMRTSLRRDCLNPVTAIVSDKSTAEAIARQFPGCHIGPINGCIKQVIGLSNTEKQSKSRLKNLIELRDLNSLVMHRQSEALELTNATAVNDSNYCPSWEKMSPNPIYIGIGVQNIPKQPGFLDLALGVTYMSHIYKQSVVGIKDDSPMAFVKAMKKIYTNHIISEKDESLLFNGVTYKTEESRTLKNVDYASIVVIDIDNGDLTPKKFKEIFTKEVKHSFFMCNSFSRSIEKPNNYRAVFFINQVVNDEIYRKIHQYLQEIIAQNGYITCSTDQRNKLKSENSKLKFSGIDLSKTHTASFFYLPCKVQSRIDQAFFWKCNLKDDAQLKRYAINVEKVIQNTPVTTTLSKLIYETPPVQQTAQHATNGYEIDVTDLATLKEFIKKGNFKHLGEHGLYGRMSRAMNDAGFTLEDFIEITPFISETKTTKDAKTTWHSWKDYKQINKGTLFHHLGLKRSKA
jgi:hypothetical protein